MAILWTSERDANNNQYANRVLSVQLNKSYQVMSDIWASADWALIWDDATNSPKNVLVNVYDMNPSGWVPAKITVDADVATKSKYRQWKIDLETKRLIEDAELDAQQIRKGCIAKVVKGKNGVGTVGKVVVVMSATYGMGWRSSVEKKLGIATSDVTYKKALPNGKVVDAHKDMVWVWARNAVRVDVPKVDHDEIRRSVEETIAA